MEGKTKTARIDQKLTFFYVFVFFLKVQDIRRSKTPIFERKSHKFFFGQVLTIFQTSRGDNLITQPFCFKSASPTCISLIGDYEHVFQCKAGFKSCIDAISWQNFYLQLTIEQIYAFPIFIEKYLRPFGCSGTSGSCSGSCV